MQSPKREVTTMKNKAADTTPMLLWSDYFGEEHKAAQKKPRPNLSLAALALAIGLSSLFWAVVLVTSHILK